MVRERRKPARKEISIKLSDDQIVEYAKRAGELRSQKALIQEEFARTKASFKGRIEAKESEISELLTAIDEGQITKEAEVVEVFDFDAGEVEVEYEGDVVQVRKMTAEERQLGLKLVEKPAEDKPQAELPLQAPSQLGDPEPFRTELPAPEDCPAGEVFIGGEPDRATIVKYLAIQWKLAPGESAMFRVTEQDVFGNTVKTWDKAKSMDVAPVATEEVAQ
jgi:hypothetical protein